MPHDVTQADCAAVDQWVREWKDCVGWHPALLQAFAAHRLAAIAEERAKVVAWLRGAFCQKRHHPEDQAYARFIADAIARADHLGDGGV